MAILLFYGLIQSLNLIFRLKELSDLVLRYLQGCKERDMKNYTERMVNCPHCGHSIRITLDASNGSQEFYDDCPACCHAIHLNMMVDERLDKIELFVDADDEQIF
jgi:transcription elongation factor Elf1